MRSGLGIAIFHELGQGEHDSRWPGLDQIAIPRRQRFFQLRIHRQKMTIQRRGAVLGFLEAQREDLTPRLQLHGRERLDQVIVGAGHLQLGHFIRRRPAGEHNDLEVGPGGDSRRIRKTSLPLSTGMSMSSKIRSKGFFLTASRASPLPSPASSQTRSSAWKRVLAQGADHRFVVHDQNPPLPRFVSLFLDRMKVRGNRSLPAA